MLRHPWIPRAVPHAAVIRLSALALALLSSLACVVVARAQNITYTYTLRWTAPGDDSVCGRAIAYDLRYSLSPITASNWNSVVAFSGVQAPGPAGTRESFTLYALDARYSYYVAMKTVDESGNWSKLSNVVLIHPPASLASASDSLAFALSQAYPNPAHAATRFAFALPQAGMVEMEAIDVAGRHVRTLARGMHPAGRTEIAWDLADDQGRPVAAGVYFVRSRLAERVTTRVVTVVR